MRLRLIGRESSESDSSGPMIQLAARRFAAESRMDTKTATAAESPPAHNGLLGFGLVVFSYGLAHAAQWGLKIQRRF